MVGLSTQISSQYLILLSDKHFVRFKRVIFLSDNRSSFSQLLMCRMLWNVLSALSLLRVALIDVLTVIITDIVSCYSYTAVNHVLSLFIGPGNTTGQVTYQVPSFLFIKIIRLISLILDLLSRSLFLRVIFLQLTHTSPL